MDNGYNFDGLTNPKRVIESRIEAAEGGASAPAPASASGGTPQADLSKARKPTQAEQALKQKKLAQKLRNRE